LYAQGEGHTVSSSIASRTVRMNGSEESDRPVVPMNQTNKTGKPEAESGEGRERTKENTLEPHTSSTQSESSVLTLRLRSMSRIKWRASEIPHGLMGRG
jgi:hypothetical protein